MTSHDLRLDIRQSDNWSIYLKTLGWKIVKTDSGINIAVYKTLIGALIKIQRPINVTAEDLKDADKLCRENKALFVRFEVSAHQDMKVFEEAGYKNSYFPLVPTSTIYINLEKSENDLWNKLSKSAKYSINRAKRENVKVEFFQKPNIDILKKYYEVLKYTGKQKKFYVQTFKDLVSRAEIFDENSFVVFAYDRNGNLATAKFFQGNEDEILYTHGGTTKEGRKGKAGYLLTWETFLYFKSIGYKIMDFEGVDDYRFKFYTNNWGGFSHFKEKFGGELIRFPFPQVKFLNPIFNLLSKVVSLPM